jgi:hypothetical protein
MPFHLFLTWAAIIALLTKKAITYWQSSFVVAPNNVALSLYFALL